MALIGLRALRGDQRRKEMWFCVEQRDLRDPHLISLSHIVKTQKFATKSLLCFGRNVSFSTTSACHNHCVLV